MFYFILIIKTNKQVDIYCVNITYIDVIIILNTSIHILLDINSQMSNQESKLQSVCDLFSVFVTPKEIFKNCVYMKNYYDVKNTINTIMNNFGNYINNKNAQKVLLKL